MPLAILRRRGLVIGSGIELRLTSWVAESNNCTGLHCLLPVTSSASVALAVGFDWLRRNWPRVMIPTCCVPHFGDHKNQTRLCDDAEEGEEVSPTLRKPRPWTKGLCGSAKGMLFD